MTVTAARTLYMRLQMERIETLELGVHESCAHIRYLSAAIAAAKIDYIARAVVEIAAIRADLDSPSEQDQTVFSN
jgi:predicted nucleic acid-binding Zn finger protein